MSKKTLSSQECRDVAKKYALEDLRTTMRKLSEEYGVSRNLIQKAIHSCLQDPSFPEEYCTKIQWKLYELSKVSSKGRDIVPAAVSNSYLRSMAKRAETKSDLKLKETDVEKLKMELAEVEFLLDSLDGFNCDSLEFPHTEESLITRAFKLKDTLSTKIS
ncbi:hypothetical protein D3C76_1207050 [compost metagenome]